MKKILFMIWPFLLRWFTRAALVYGAYDFGTSFIGRKISTTVGFFTNNTMVTVSVILIVGSVFLFVFGLPFLEGKKMKSGRLAGLSLIGFCSLLIGYITLYPSLDYAKSTDESIIINTKIGEGKIKILDYFKHKSIMINAYTDTHLDDWVQKGNCHQLLAEGVRRATCLRINRESRQKYKLIIQAILLDDVVSCGIILEHPYLDLENEAMYISAFPFRVKRAMPLKVAENIGSNEIFILIYKKMRERDLKINLDQTLHYNELLKIKTT